MGDREERIRQRAYGIWQEEGEPHGRAAEHWHRAERELDEQTDGIGEEQPTVGPDSHDEPVPVPDIGRASSLQPGGTIPGAQPGAGMGSLGTGGGSTAGRATGNRRRAKR